MPAPTAADTIRILVATDNHVGYNERDAVRGDDSWKTFHEIMCLAKDRDVDMVLLAGDLFHDNKPSRKAMYNVMRSLRLNCYGEKPCELEMLSDGSELFDATFTHANYEDPDINIAVPVFSIHGNHDDPAGEGHFAALNILEVAGLLNYFGRTPQSDNIQVKPVLLQKGRTKLALYGLSNVRDERMYHSFRDGKVNFFQPRTQNQDWFNLICVHQNHHAYTETSYLPENFLPEFLDYVIWGHEHECDIQPHINPEMKFKVLQPGSSVATSLVPGEAVAKHVAILSITGRECKTEPIRLRTVRPFVYKDMALSQEKEAVKIAKKENHRAELTRFLMRTVDKLIEQANQEWQEAQEENPGSDDEDEPAEAPLPLIRLRIETTSSDGVTKFDVENPQRFSNRFIGKVANTQDVIQFHTRKKTTAAAALRAGRDAEEDKKIMAKHQTSETVKIEKLVHDFLEAQSLTILPQNYFGDAVNQFVDKDDRHAMEVFVNESLAGQIEHLVKLQDEVGIEDDDEEGTLASQIAERRQELEELFAKGAVKAARNKARYKPKPDDWDTDIEGEWEDAPQALIPNKVGSDNEEEATPAPRTTTTRSRGRGRGGRGTSTTTTRRAAAPASKAAAKKSTTTTTAKGRGRKKAVSSEEESEEEDNDVMILDDDEDEDFHSTRNNNEDEDEDEEESSQAMFFTDKPKPSSRSKANDKASTRSAVESASTSRAASVTNGSTTAATASRRLPPSMTASAGTTKLARGGAGDGSRASTTTTAAAPRRPPPRMIAKQSALSFTASQRSVMGGVSPSVHDGEEIVDDNDDDDDDAFEPVSAGAPGRRGGAGGRGRR